MKPLLIASMLICLLPVAAAAQEAAAAAQSSGPMVVQQMHSTFVIAPDVKYSRFDHTDAWIAGAYGGILVDEQWLIGAGGYWLTNGNHGRSLGYGGGIVGWTSGVDRPVAFSVRSLIGWGEAELTDTIQPVPYYPYTPSDRFDFGMNQRPGTSTRPPIVPPAYQVHYHEQFFVAEPQADVNFRIASWGRLNAGVGYRAVGDTHHGDDHRIRGATASVSLQVGSF